MLHFSDYGMGPAAETLAPKSLFYHSANFILFLTGITQAISGQFGKQIGQIRLGIIVKITNIFKKLNFGPRVWTFYGALVSALGSRPWDCETFTLNRSPSIFNYDNLNKYCKLKRQRWKLHIYYCKLKSLRFKRCSTLVQITFCMEYTRCVEYLLIQQFGEQYEFGFLGTLFQAKILGRDTI